MDDEFAFKRFLKRLDIAGVQRNAGWELSWPVVVKPPTADHQFNALDYVHQLQQAGVPLVQAEVHTNALVCVFAEVALLKEAVRNLRDRVVDLKDRVDDLRERIDKLETRMNWMIGLIVATQLGIFTMVAGLYLR